MKIKQNNTVALLALFLAILLAACGKNNVPTAQYIVVTASAAPVTNTPNPCAPENINAEVQKVHKHMREFDDASTLAANRPKDQFSGAIAELQRIRREAEDQPIPSCLTNLKTYQISHMNAVINTLIAFMGGADQQTVDKGIGLARSLHDKYTIELASLLGITIVPGTAIIAPATTVVASGITIVPSTETPSP